MVAALTTAIKSSTPPLNANDVLDRWTIVTKLGEGGFGAVYKVRQGSVEYALKTERLDADAKTLKMEVVVLKELKKSDATHSCELLDSGRCRGYNYIVMTLVGKSLQELRKDKPVDEQRFSLGCAISVSMQCLEAIQELHNLGYLHRDIKPANFAIGLDPRKILVLDFGMCRKFIEKDHTLRKPRWSAGFRGTLRYAAIACHLSKEMSRKDDLESWLYQTIELTNGALTWKGVEDAVQVCHMKEKGRTTDTTILLARCPKEYLHIMIYIDRIQYYDDPDFAIIRGLLRDALNANELSEYPYDWEKTDSKEKTAKTAVQPAKKK